MLKNMSIRLKLLLMVLAPVIGLLVFSTREVVEKYHVLESVSETRTLTGLAVRVGSLSHEIQKERGLSSGFINSKGEKFRDELAKQRELVNGEIVKVKEYVTANSAALDHVKKPLDAANGGLETLKDVRGTIDTLKIEGKDSFSFYTKQIGSYIDVVAAVSTTSKSHEIMRAATTYYAFVKAKEENGKERATLNAVLAADSFNDEAFQRVLSILSAQKNYLDLFRQYATSAEQVAFDDKSKSPAFSKVEDLRGAVLAKGMAGGFGITPESWFSAATEKINIMKEEEDMLTKDIVTVADGLAAGARGALVFSIALSVILGGIAIVLGLLVVISITAPLSRMLHMLKDIAEGEGDLTKRLDTDRNDEFGELSHW